MASLGFNTGSTDGILGPRSRDMVAAWQIKRGDPGTGFLSGAQLQALKRDAITAITKFDDDQKKVDEEAKARAATPATPAAAAPPVANDPSKASGIAAAASTNAYDGDYAGAQDCSNGSTLVDAVVGGRVQVHLCSNDAAPR